MMALHANRPASNARPSSCLLVFLFCCAVQFLFFGACPASSTKCPSLIMRVSAVNVTSKSVSVEKHFEFRES